MKDDITAAIQAAMPKQSTHPERSLIEQLREIKAVEREFATPTPTTPQADPLEQALKIMERVNTFNDYLRPVVIDPDASTLEKVLPMFQPVIPQVVNALSNFAAGFAQSRGATPVTTPTDSAQTNGTAYDQMLNFTVDELLANAPTNRAATALRQFEAQHPEYATQMQVLKTAPPAALIQHLSNAPGWQLVA